MKRKGSFTIEASIVISMIMFVVFFLMQLSFFVYNRQAAVVLASQAVLQGVQMETSGKQTIRKSLDCFLEQETEGKLIFTDSVCWDVTVTLTKVKVTLSLTQKSLFRPLSCKITQEMSRIHPTTVLWEAERWKP